MAKKTSGGGFNQKWVISEELAVVVGKGAYSRSELVSKLWKYFKKNKLNKGREISADVKLKPVFGKGKITMFEVGGIIGKHLKTKA
jgi:chromatin remodeling complex protein RSC6